MAAGAPIMGAIATLARGGCGATGAGAASSCAGGLLEPNSDPPNIEPAVSQPARPMPTIASRMARATTGFQRRAAAASMVVTTTSPSADLVRSLPAADVQTLRRVIPQPVPQRTP